MCVTLEATAFVNPVGKKSLGYRVLRRTSSLTHLFDSSQFHPNLFSHDDRASAAISICHLCSYLQNTSHPVE
ncbi:hypothetical protein [Mastigocladopsis repens]|uniref:hypothetical protein n=1 Tax=Mastigocladopsis repens TaxID=221287 RepID=UPI0012EA251D